MFRIIIVISSLVLTFKLSAQSNEYQYIWAPSGLNLRAAPSVKSDIVGKLPFGDSLIVISETGISYNTIGIKDVDTSGYYYDLGK